MDKLQERDSRVVWHPYQFFDAPCPLPVTAASGSRITLSDGRELIDAISSWWVNIHGHCHPEITRAISQQAEKLDQVIFAGFTHEPAVTLAEQLLTVLPENQRKIFYSDNGSTAVEIAIKLSIQYWWNRGTPRTKILAVQNGYHGDTFGAMSAGSPSAWVAPFRDLLFEVEYIPSPESPECLEMLEALLDSHQVCALICEPLIQGAGGMRMHSAQALSRLIALCRERGVPTIADEVMTGFGRTGAWFASTHLASLRAPPDMVCLSKALTGGVLPLAVTSCSQEIFDAFQKADRSKTFFHGHSFTGNPISCAAAVKSFELLSSPVLWERIGYISHHASAFASTLREHPRVENPRSCGIVFACDVKTGNAPGYFSPIRDHVVRVGLARGVLLRPLGNVMYVLPPYCISDAELLTVFETILEAIETLPDD